MLYSLTGLRRILDIPYRREYDLWVSRLTPIEHQAIIDELSNRIGDKQIQTSSWLPGKDWTGTVFEPIYSKACNKDYVQAAQFFGLLVWETFLRHPDCWAFGRYELDGVPLEGLTYFKISTDACSNPA